MDTNEAKDIVKAAPTAIFLMPKFPEEPRVVEVKSGDDLQELVRTALGGDPELEREPAEDEAAMGVLAVYVRGDLRLHVHSHPEAFEGLKYAIERMRMERQVQDVLDQLGIKNATVIRVKPICICGQCGILPDDAEEEDLS